MIYELLEPQPDPVSSLTRYGWYLHADRPETQLQREWRITKAWLFGNLPARDIPAWKRILEPKQTGSSCLTPDLSPARLLQLICEHHSPELVHLLYPRYPVLFLHSHSHRFSPSLFDDSVHTALDLQNIVLAREARLNAACLFACSGAVNCLEALLEEGADPNGMDCPEGWSHIGLLRGDVLPVTPMDCALLANQEECCLLLELYGGKSILELASP